MLIIGLMIREKVKIRLCLISVLMCSIIYLGLGIGYAQETAQKYQFDIKRGTLEQGLDHVHEQTGIQLIYPHELAQTTEIPSVTGLYTIPEVLDLMLRETSLSGGLTESGMIVISPPISAEAQIQKGNMMKSTSIKSSLLAGVSALLFGAGGAPALAQDGASGSEDTIIVQGRSFRNPSDETATKLSTPLRETAGQVLVLNEDFNDALGNLGVLDTIEFLPGATNISVAGDGFFIIARGFGLNRANAFRLNGAPIGSDALFDQSAISRLEYIKGSQAAAYGQISAAGFINLALKEAGTDEAEGNVQVRADSNGGIRAEATYGGPINEAGTVRLLGSVAREQSPTQYDGNLNDLRSQSIYGNLAVDLTDRLTTKFYVYY
ncbi:MAG: TonB-dependent receptor plug domain-containing protein, partial [Pseudomonadota bacterium]